MQHHQPHTVVFEGLLSVQAAIKGETRKVEEVWVTSNQRTHKVMCLLNQAKMQGIKILRKPRADIDAMASGQTHGGIVALAGRRQYRTLDRLLATSHAPLLVMLDGVEDPYNFGQAIRAIHAAGSDGLIVGSRDWASAESIVARASAGASEFVPTVRTENVDRTCEELAERGLTIAMTAHDRRACTIYEADLTGPLLIMLGGERRGVRRSLRRRVDLLLRVPYGRRFGPSLGTTAAAAAVTFEAMRQRMATQS